MAVPQINDVDLSALPLLAPPISSIDLSALDGVVNSATLEFFASGVGVVPVSAYGAAELGLTASGLAVVGFGGAGSSSLSLSAAGSGYQDWVSILSPLQMQEVYRLVITGAENGLDDLVIGGISSWQATNQAGARSSYVQAVIPAADQYLSGIDARKNGELVIEKGYRLAGGLTRHEEILRAKFDLARPDQGRRSLTLTVSGYMRGKPLSSGSRTLTGIRMISKPGGKRRVTCDIDLFLQPGMTVTALSETFRADYINYYVTQSDKFCEVGER